jgi:anaerobic selenocysteine-containing dehydrogenase
VTRTVRSFCRICQAHCGILVELDGEQVVRVSGDPDHPLSQGYTCSKGRALGLAHHDPDGLRQPELHGEPTTWDALLGDLAASLRRIVDEHGPDAIALYRSTAWILDTTARSIVDRWTRAIGTRQLYSPNTIDTPNRMLVPDLVLGAPFVQPVVDWERTELLLAVGSNLVVSHGHATSVTDPIRRIREIQQRGGKVVVADPRRTETARLADLHLQVRPGTDAALLAHFVAQRLDGRCDQAYVEAHAEPGSLDRLREAVAPYDRDAVAALCDIGLDELDAADALVRTPERLSPTTGTGVSMGPAPNAGEWLSWALAMVTGSLDREGGLLFNPGVIRPQSDTGPTTLPRVTAPSPSSRPEHTHFYGEYPSAILADEILAGNVRAVLCFGGNIASSFPDAARTEAALRSLDVFAVSDLHRTRTAELATHLLPTCGQLERHDVTYFIDQAFPVPFAQYTPPVVEPIGDRRELWRVMADLCERMGIALPPVTATGDSRELVRSIVKRARVPFEEIEAAPSGLAVDGLPTEWLVPDRLPRGALDLAPEPLVAELARWRTAAVRPAGSLQLICRRLPHQMNSDLQELPRQQRAPYPTLLMHPDDATRRALGDGAHVVVASPSGTTHAVVERTDSIRAGVVSLPHSWRDPDVNALTSAAALDPLTGMPRFSGFEVEVAPA